jgi:thiol-disulfide isomerase/thioredoxin
MRITLTLAALLPLALAGCNSDKDEDGLTKAEELEIGTDPELADSDGDGLSDGDEHLIHGTDPLEMDSDGDGFDDGAEIDFGSDALEWLSYPWGEGVTQWPDNSERVLLSAGAPGWNMDNLPGNFEFIDQYGNPGSFHQFYGHVILVDFSAGWCGPCRTVAAKAQGVYEEHADKGFLIFHMMTDDNSGGGGVTDDTFLAAWADQYGITFPVVKDSSNAAFNAVAKTPLYQGGIPFMVLLDQQMLVVQAETGSGSEGRLETKALELLGY